MSCSMPSWLATSVSSQWTGAGRVASGCAWSCMAAHTVSASWRYLIETPCMWCGCRFTVHDLWAPASGHYRTGSSWKLESTSSSFVGQIYTSCSCASVQHCSGFKTQWGFLLIPGWKSFAGVRLHGHRCGPKMFWCCWPVHHTVCQVFASVWTI